VVSSTPQPYFTPRQDPVPIVQEAEWASGPSRQERKISHSHRDSIPGRPAHISVPIPTELPGPLQYQQTIIKLHSGCKFHIAIRFFIGTGIDTFTSSHLFNAENYGSFETKRRQCSYYCGVSVREQRSVLQKVGLLKYRIGQEFGKPRRGPNQTTLNARVIELF
jgi:hypothetical protein